MCETAYTGTLEIRISTSIYVDSDFISVEIEATNNGTEPAHNLRSFFYILDKSLESEALKILEVKQTRIFRFKIPVPPEKKGQFPFVGEILFHDANRHPFSALSCDSFNLKNKTIARLTGNIPDLTIKVKGNLSLQVTNLASYPRKCTATLYLPNGSQVG